MMSFCRLFSFVLCGLFYTAVIAQQSTDIYLMDVDFSNGFEYYNAELISVNDGYNNQPNFSANGNYLLYTSIANEYADIYRYDIKSKKTTQITHSQESEFSPTLLQNQNEFSTVRVEKDGTQRLWKINQNDASASLLLPSVKGVGYHTWLTENKLALFVVGAPHQMHIANVKKDNSKQVGEKIGSAIHKVPNEKKFAYIDWSDSTNCNIKTRNFKGKNEQSICPCAPEAEYFIHTPNGNLLSVKGTALYYWDKKSYDKQWQNIANFTEIDGADFYRLAINADASKLAIVGYRF